MKIQGTKKFAELLHPTGGRKICLPFCGILHRTMLEETAWTEDAIIQTAVQCKKKETNKCAEKVKKKIEKGNRRDSNHGLREYQTCVITTRPSMLGWMERQNVYKKRSQLLTEYRWKKKVKKYYVVYSVNFYHILYGLRWRRMLGSASYINCYKFLVCV